MSHSPEVDGPFAPSGPAAPPGAASFVQLSLRRSSGGPPRQTAHLGGGMRRIGEILVDAKAISEEARDRALAVAKAGHVTFGTAILEAGAIPEHLLLRALSVQSSSPPVEAEELASIPRDVLGLVPGQLARKYSVLPFRKVGRTLHLAMAYPWDGGAAAEIELRTGLAVLRHVAISARIVAALDRHYALAPSRRQEALSDRLDRIHRMDLPHGEAPRNVPASPLLPAHPGSSSARPSLALRDDETLFETVATVRGAEPVALPLEAIAAPLPGSRRAWHAPDPLGGLPVQLGCAKGRDAIGSAILASLAGCLRTAALFSIEGDRLEGWMSRPEPREPFHRFSVRFSPLSVFSTVRTTARAFAGLFPYTGPNRRILRALGIRFPAVIAVMPIVTDGRIAHGLLGESVGGVDDLPLAQLRRCAAMAGTALEILALRARLRQNEDDASTLP